jgi:secreted trypsin-like serine protease
VTPRLTHQPQWTQIEPNEQYSTLQCPQIYLAANLVIVQIAIISLAAMFKPAVLLALAASAYGYVYLAFHSDEVKAATTPYVAALSSDRNGRVRCVGNLIAPTIVLTSAACLDNDIQFASIGATFVNDTSTAETIQVKSAFRHPGYNAETHANDVAVLELVRASHAKPVAISWNPVEANQVATLRGWGQVVDGTKVNAELMEVGVTTWNNVDCAFSFGRVGGGDIQDSVLCAGGRATQACIGDAGDALTIESANGDDHLVAVYSWGVECDAEGVPGAYTRLSSVRTFVEQYLKKVSPRFSY